VGKSEYESTEAEAAPHQTGDRTPSAAQLAWFLHAVWRLDLADVDDAICDGGGDKGVDGMVVNDDLNEIAIFQSKHRKSATAGQGDKDLRNLVGAAAYFQTPDTVDGLLASKPNAELRNLIGRLNIRERVADGATVTRLVFVTNGTLDDAGADYIRALEGQQPELEVWDQPRLSAVAARTKAPDLRPDEVKFTAVAAPSRTDLKGDTTMAIALVPAAQLVSLNGIDDLTLFDRNVRLSEGRTRVNRELAATIKDSHEHALFPAYHNGLTLLTHKLGVRGRRLTLDRITVVNGCQSLLTLYENRAAVSDDLNLLVKVVEVEPNSQLTEKITFRSNNQNPVDIRDQRSTDIIQRGLQAEVRETYDAAFAYGIREGESLDAAQVLSNQEAAQLLMAVYLGEPYNAVRKVRLFDTDYRRIFNRQVTAPRLYLLKQVADTLVGLRDRLRPDLAASFSSIRFTLAYLLAKQLQRTSEGEQLLEDPSRWLPEKLADVRTAIENLAEEIIDSVNFHIEEEESEKGDDFDPKVIFKSQTGVRGVENAVDRDIRRAIKKDDSFLFKVKAVR
jgi:AIPR protein